MSPAKVLKPVSFEEYLAFEEKAQTKHELVDSLSRRVEGYYREGKRWLYLDVAGEGRFPVPCPEMGLSLDEVYEGLEVPLERPDPEFQA